MVTEKETRACIRRVPGEGCWGKIFCLVPRGDCWAKGAALQSPQGGMPLCLVQAPRKPRGGSSRSKVRSLAHPQPGEGSTWQRVQSSGHATVLKGGVACMWFFKNACFRAGLSTTCMLGIGEVSEDLPAPADCCPSLLLWLPMELQGPAHDGATALGTQPCAPHVWSPAAAQEPPQLCSSHWLLQEGPPHLPQFSCPSDTVHTPGS